MLKAAIARTRRIQQEHVSIEVAWRAQHLHVTAAERLQVVAQARHVGACLAANGKHVRNAVDLELSDRNIRNLYRMIDEFVIVCCNVGAKAVGLCAIALHRGNDAPGFGFGNFRRDDVHFARGIFLADDLWKHAGTVEVCMRFVEMRAAHTFVLCVNVENER